MVRAENRKDNDSLRRFTDSRDIIKCRLEGGISKFVNRLHEAGLLTIPSGAQVVRLLPALNLRRDDAAEGIAIVESVVKTLA